jgi:hypothetical protein
MEYLLIQSIFMNPNEVNQTSQNQSSQQQVPVQQAQSTQPVYVESKTSKIMRETGTVVAGVSMLASLIAVVKGIFKK